MRFFPLNNSLRRSYLPTPSLFQAKHSQSLNHSSDNVVSEIPNFSVHSLPSPLPFAHITLKTKQIPAVA